MGLTANKNEQFAVLPHSAANSCFGCGRGNKYGLRLNFFMDGDQQIVCHLRLAARFAGPPGYAHGGIIATLLDEAMSKANRQHGIVAMTRHMEVEYLRPVPLRQEVTLTGMRISQQGRKNFCEATVASADGTILARGKALFIAINAGG